MTSEREGVVEDEPAASVSSLRSRFENLATTNASTSSPAVARQPTPEPPPRPLRPSHTGSAARGGPGTSPSFGPSLDIPRQQSPVPGTAGGVHRSNTLPRGFANSPRQRPVSVYSTFSPPIPPPALKVESPSSPDKHLRLDTNGWADKRTPVTTGLATPSTHHPPRIPSVPGSPSVRPQHAKPPPPPPPPPPISLRPPRPQSMFVGKQTLPSEPPPVPARNTKPKIPSRPSIPPNSTRAGRNEDPKLALQQVERYTEGISPFSTPPSSANNSPTRSESDSHPRNPAPPRNLAIPPTNPRITTPPPPLPPPRPDPPAPPPQRPLRYEDPELPLRQFNRHEEPELPSRHTLPPPRMSMDQVRPRIKISDSVKAQRMSVDDVGARPDLPPRPGGLIGGVRARMARGRSHSPPKGTITSPATFSTSSPGVSSTFLPPPRRETQQIVGRSSSPEDAYAGPYGNGDDSDDGIDDQSGLSDYPDSSQANRRRPYFPDGIREINCKSDVKLFAVCGQYVCTISHSTKVWDIATGECIMAVPHGENVKITAVAFKPSANVHHEGRAVWIGSQHGELSEIDIPSQTTTKQRSNAHAKKAIIKIHRSGFDLWSIDDNGKIQVWSGGEEGSPNLRNSPTTFRINARHTCSIVIGGHLWVGHGKAIDVYHPSTDTSQPFHVSNRQIVPSRQTGEITCAAVINNQPDKVFFGHSDGNVSIYSRSTLQCIEVVSVSLYKINSMTGVGDYLWAGFKTGMVYVYDTRVKPWRALKDWQCSGGPINEVIADRTSVWKNGRLQVVTLGADNIIRTWDGMMQDDWLEAEMQKNDIEFCTFSPVSALICTWNAGASKPQDLLTRDGDKTFLQDILHSSESFPDILVFGFQELVDLEDKKITAKTIFKNSKHSKKKRAADQQEHMSHQYRLWQQQLTKSTGAVELGNGDHYVLLHVANLVGLFTCMFVKASIKDRIQGLAAATIKRGLGGLHGNKGAIVIRFLLDDSSLCFINCHLAAGQSHTMSRNNDIAAILEASPLPDETSRTIGTDMFVGGGDGTMILDHEVCILNGDLNYRIDLARESAVHKVKNNDFPALLERDQLLVERRKNPGFRLRVFNEAPLTFAPTYKYDVGTDTYDTSDKKRVPAWCDRVLYRGRRKVEQTQYRRWEVKASDHRPVSAVLKISVKTVDPARRKAVWERCVQRLEEVRTQFIWDAKMDYLVNVCGYDPERAQRTLERKEDVVDAVASLERHR